MNVRPHVCCASISPVNSTYNQYFIVITILLIHSCGLKRTANYFCQDLFKVTGVTALSVMVGLAEHYPHADFRGSIITPAFCTSFFSTDSRLAPCGCAAITSGSTVAVWNLSGFEPRALCFYLALGICTDVAGSCLLSDLAA